MSTTILFQLKNFLNHFNPFTLLEGWMLSQLHHVSKAHPATLTSEKYGISKREILKVCISTFMRVFALEDELFCNGYVPAMTVTKLPFFYKERDIFLYPNSMQNTFSKFFLFIESFHLGGVKLLRDWI